MPPVDEGLLAGVAVELSPRPPSRAGSWVAKEPYLLLLLFGLGFLVFLVFSLAWAGFFPWIFFVSCGLGGWVGLLSLGSLLLFLLLLLLLDLVSLTEGVSADDMVENSDRGRPSRLSCKPPEEGGWGGVLGRDLEVVGDGESQEERRRPKASLDVFAEGERDGDCVSGRFLAE